MNMKNGESEVKFVESKFNFVKMNNKTGVSKIKLVNLNSTSMIRTFKTETLNVNFPLPDQFLLSHEFNKSFPEFILIEYQNR